MLHLFRLLRKKLIEDGNIRKYIFYALGEILLVMIGILLALQVNNWNAERNNHRKEQVILQSLKDDFEQNLDTYQGVYAIVERGYESNKTMLDIISSNDRSMSMAEIDTVVSSIINDFSSLDVISSTVDEIINTGELSIIQDPQLRKQLSNWSKIIADTNDDVKIAEEYLFPILAPALKDRFVLKNIPIPTYIIERTGISPINRSGFRVDYHTTIHDVEFENVIYINALNIAYMLNSYKNLEEYLRDTLVLIDRNLNRN